MPSFSRAIESHAFRGKERDTFVGTKVFDSVGLCEKGFSFGIFKGNLSGGAIHLHDSGGGGDDVFRGGDERRDREILFGEYSRLRLRESHCGHTDRHLGDVENVGSDGSDHNRSSIGGDKGGLPLRG